MSRLWLLGGRGWGEGDHEWHLWPAGGTLGREAGSPLCSQRAWMEAEGARWVRSPWAPGWPRPQQVELESGGGLSVPHCHLCLRAKTASSRAGPPPRAAAPGPAAWPPGSAMAPCGASRPSASPAAGCRQEASRWTREGHRVRGGGGRCRGGRGGAGAVLRIPPLTRAGIAPSAPPWPGPGQASSSSRLHLASLSDLTPCCPSPLQPGISVTM